MEGKFCFALLSGGLDSATMLYELISQKVYHEIFPMHFNFGQRYFVFERLCVARICRELGLTPQLLDLESIYKPWFSSVNLSNLQELRFELPFRNLLLLCGAGIIGQSFLLTRYGDRFREKSHGFDIAIAVHRHVTYNEYWDIRREFVEGVNQLFSQVPFRVRVVAPFLDLEKKQIVEKSRNLDWRVLKYTATCYSPVYYSEGEELFVRPCGACESCIERSFRDEFEDVNDYEMKFTYKEAIENGIPPRTLREVFLDRGGR